MIKQTLKTSDTSIIKKSDNKMGIKMTKKEGVSIAADFVVGIGEKLAYL